MKSSILQLLIIIAILLGITFFQQLTIDQNRKTISILVEYAQENNKVNDYQNKLLKYLVEEVK
jgi:uncharacterized protein YxeA